MQATDPRTGGMTRETYLEQLERLELNQENAGEYFGASARTGQRWASEEGPPLAVAMALLAAKNRQALDRLRERARRGDAG